MSLNTPLTIMARNVNDAFAQAHGLVSGYRAHGLPYAFNVNTQHRNVDELGPVIQATYPVTTVYDAPEECVLFHPTRNANPFFHLLEALWMLNGDHDVQFPAYLVSRMATYSDDGTVFHGAYGFRWREWFDVDQVRAAIRLLRHDPHSRRVVIGMWDPHTDLLYEGKDAPCNLMMKLEVSPSSNAVNATVFNRSNDVIWGCYGANAVQFSILLQFIAGALGRPVGWLCQFSANWHVYEKTLPLFGTNRDEHTQPYATINTTGFKESAPRVRPMALFHNLPALDTNGQHTEHRWLSELATFIQFVRTTHAVPAPEEAPLHRATEFMMQSSTIPFLKAVAAPMVDAVHAVKCYQRTQAGAYLQSAVDILGHALYDLPRNDWLTAGMSWVRRFAKRQNISIAGGGTHVR